MKLQRRNDIRVDVDLAGHELPVVWNVHPLDPVLEKLAVLDQAGVVYSLEIFKHTIWDSERFRHIKWVNNL